MQRKKSQGNAVITVQGKEECDKARRIANL